MCLGAIEPLYRLISHEDKTAVVSLGVMASNNSGFSESSGRAATKCPPPLLLELLRSDFPVIQQLALRTIENITTDSESHVGFRNVQGFDRILEILRPKEFSDLHEGALRVILNCLQMMGGLEQLLQFVGTSTLPEASLWRYSRKSTCHQTVTTNLVSWHYRSFWTVIYR
ncbi:armadillo repeat-containing protein 3-like isoform X2 [Cyprinus carpio]|nr:armadillo repeat-containing protein 3-like isoform X2 [Cyprinus carpio]